MSRNRNWWHMPWAKKRFDSGKLTIGRLKELISDMPDDALVAYHAYDDNCGCCLGNYMMDDAWKYPKDGVLKPGHTPALVLNPGGGDYDCRHPGQLEDE